MCSRRTLTSTLLWLPNAPTTPGNWFDANLIWNALAPLIQRIDSLHAVTDFCAFYGPECVGLTLSLSALTLAGVVVFKRVSDGAARMPAPQRQRTPVLTPDI